MNLKSARPKFKELYMRPMKSILVIALLSVTNAVADGGISEAALGQARSELVIGLGVIDKILGPDIDKAAKDLGTEKANVFILESRGLVSDPRLSLAEAYKRLEAANMKLETLKVIQAELAKRIASKILVQLEAALP